jgi:hypothetical protein
MKHLYELIEKRANFEPCNLFIDKFNVKKFCEKFDIIYGELPSIRISDACGERFIGTLYHDTVTILHVELGELYRKDKFHLNKLLEKKFVNDCAVVILTNNENVAVDTSITDKVINYKSKKTGFFWIDLKNLIKSILNGSN